MIEKLLERPERLTPPQRELIAENEALLSGGQVLPCVRRYHRLFTYSTFAREWADRARAQNLPANPWDMSNREIFRSLAVNVAWTVATSMCKAKEGQLLASRHKGDWEEIQYLEDLLGTSKEEQDMFLAGVFLWRMNFLLRAWRDPNQLVRFTFEKDVICRLCKGGTKGTGAHCDTDEPRKEDTFVERTLRLYDLRHRTLVALDGGNVGIPMYMLFDPVFVSGLMDQARSILPLRDRVRRARK